MLNPISHACHLRVLLNHFHHWSLHGSSSHDAVRMTTKHSGFMNPDQGVVVRTQAHDIKHHLLANG